MTIKSKPKTRREKFRAWKRGQITPVVMTRATINKFDDLNKILKRDMKALGIERVAVTISPFRKKGLAGVNIAQLKVEGEEKRRIPLYITFDYRLVENLSTQELRHIAWHEFGHFIFRYYYPSIAKDYQKKTGALEVEEAFADEFAYRKFGEDFARTIIKLSKIDKISSEKRKLEKAYWKELRAYVKENGYGYWKGFAKENNISIKYDPKNTTIIGVKPKKHVLGSLR